MLCFRRAGLPWVLIEVQLGVFVCAPFARLILAPSQVLPQGRGKPVLLVAGFQLFGRRFAAFVCGCVFTHGRKMVCWRVEFKRFIILACLGGG